MTDIYFAKDNVHFTKTEKKLIDYIIASPRDFIRMSIGDVARCIGSSEPTVSPTVLQQHMFVYSLKAFCMAAYKLFLFLKF